MSEQLVISGNVRPGFEAVREAFAQNFEKRHEVGASVAVVRDGQYLVDLWGGWADEARTRPWEADSIVNVWSTTKGFVSLSAHMLIDRGQLELDKPVADYWPEFAQAGKEEITVRQLMSHRAGLSGWVEPVTEDIMYDWAKLCEMLAAQEPFWEPDTQSGYHALTFAHLVGELVRRIDGRPIDEFVREEITGPLKADMFIGVRPEDDRRVADLCTTPHALPPQNPSQVKSEQEAEGVETASGDGSASDAGESAPQMNEIMLRALGNPFVGPKVANSDAWRRGVFPSANGHGNARGIAAMYGTIASGGAFGATRLFSPEAVERMREEQPTGRDLVISAVGEEMTWGMGFMVNKQKWYGSNPRAFHHGGYGGSLGFCDPEAGIGFGYAMNAMNVSTLVQDTRSVALLRAVYRCLD